MSEFLDAGLVLVVLLGSSALGGLARPFLSERHLSREVMEFVQLVIAMLVTFAALVLGLLTNSVKSSFDKVGSDFNGLSIQLIQLDRSLREWGAESEPIRELLRAYTATAIATTWPQEPKPPGNYYPTEASPIHGSQLESSITEDMLVGVERGIRGLEANDPMHAGWKQP